MLKKLVSVVLSFIIIAAAIPAAAHQNITEELIDFSSYTDTNGWNGEDMISGSFPIAQNGEFSAISAQSANNGITNSVAFDGSPYGNSVKFIQKYDSGSGACSGIKYSPDVALRNTIYFESSIYIEPTDDNNKILRGIYFRDLSGASNIDASAVLFRADNKLYIFNSSTGYNWDSGSWYDVKITYNLNNEKYFAKVYEDGVLLFEKQGTHVSKDLTCISTVQIRSQVKSKDMITDSIAWNDQIFYLDNFLLKTDYKYDPITYKTDSFDFENFKSGENIAETVTGSLGAFNWGYQGKKDCLINAVSDNEKGTSVALTSIFNDTYATRKETDNTKKYARLYYDIKEKNQDNTFFFKTSFMLKDYKFKELRIQLVQSDGSQVNGLVITDNTFNFPGDPSVISKPQLDVWYDYECTIDIASGYAQGRISGNGETYSSSWKDDAYTDAKFYRGMMTYQSLDSYDAGKESTVWIDDIEIGYIDTSLGDTFKIDTYGSTTGNRQKYEADSDVIIKFTQAVNPATVTKDCFKVNYGAVEIKDIVVSDEYTVKIVFDKKEGNHYHVEFTDISNYDTSSTISDYIEFDTVPADYITGNIIFKNESGNELAFLENGKIKAIATTVSGDGEEHPAKMWIASYDSNGNMVNITYKDVTYTGEKRENFVEIDIPSDKSVYKVKAGIWTNGLEPLTFGEIIPKVVIFKLDDLRYSYKDSKADYTYEDFVAWANWAEEENVDLSFGIICNSLEDEDGIDKSSYYKAIADMDASNNVEIWCHGYNHIQTGDAESGYNSEFNAPVEQQIETLQKCVNIVYEKTRVKLQSLGTPHNASNNDTAIALEAVDQFTTLIASGKNTLHGSTFIHMKDYINMEISTGVLDNLEEIKNKFLLKATDDYVIFAGHVARWSQEDANKFKELVSWLKTQNVVFMTPTEYYNFVK